MQTKQFFSLSTWRREVMCQKQSEIAKKLRTSQGHVSAVENGHLPEPWEWDRWANAYSLRRGEFLRMIRAAKEENLPLFADLKHDGTVVPMPRAGQIERLA